MESITIEFDPFHPVYTATKMQIETMFGKLYKYDFPKWCAENKLRCFYKPETMVYVIIPKTLEEL